MLTTVSNSTYISVIEKDVYNVENPLGVGETTSYQCSVSHHMRPYSHRTATAGEIVVAIHVRELRVIPQLFRSIQFHIGQLDINTRLNTSEPVGGYLDHVNLTWNGKLCRYACLGGFCIRRDRFPFSYQEIPVNSRFFHLYGLHRFSRI